SKSLDARKRDQMLGGMVINTKNALGSEVELNKRRRRVPSVHGRNGANAKDSRFGRVGVSGRKERRCDAARRA
ncbi:MAG: hypothetical protein AB7O79_09600, partial [Xanthobacteraceae bacterium]